MIDLTNLTEQEQSHLEQLVADPMLDAVFQHLIAKYISAWRTSTPERSDTREHLHRMVLATEGLRSELQSVAANRKIAAFNNKSRG